MKCGDRMGRTRTVVTPETYDIVFFWKQNDSGIYGRRSDMLVKYLARHPRVRRVVHFDAPIEWNQLRKKVDRRPEWRLSESNLVYAETLKRMTHLADTGAVKQYTFVYDGQNRGGLFPPRERYEDFVREALRRHEVDPERAVFWVFPKSFEFPELARALSPRFILADLVDDHRKWPCSPQYRNALDENYRKILESASLVITNCDSQREAFQEMSAQPIHVVPNACEMPNREGDGAEVPPPAELRGLSGPVIGYVGNLDSARLDLDLLKYIATERPGWNLVLIGSAHANDDILSLAEHPNVHLLGVVKYDQLPAYIRRFDVAIIPHRDNALTRSMNPLKLFVYCAAGVPVVTTEIRNIEELRDLVRVASKGPDFVQEIENLLLPNAVTSIGGQHLAILRRNDWRERADDVCSLIDEVWDDGPKSSRGLSKLVPLSSNRGFDKPSVTPSEGAAD